MDEYKVNRLNGYLILSGGLPIIDITAEYYVVACANFFGDRPIISRSDGKSFEGKLVGALIFTT